MKPGYGQKNLRQGRRACGEQQVERQMTCARQEEMVSMPGPKQGEARVETVESKWRELAEHGTEATGQQGAGEEATETGQAEAEPCTAYSSVA